MNRLKLGGACLNQIPFNWEHNLKNILSAIEQARKEKVDILCLPELSITGYGCEDMFLSDWLPQTALQQLPTIIEACQDIIVAVGLPIQFGGKVYNTTCIIYDGEIEGFYAKHHLANDGVHYEPRWFASWPSEVIEQIEIFGEYYPIGDISLTLKGVKVGFEICEDAWHEDRPACRLFENKTQLILNPSASHFAFDKAEFRENLVVESSRKFKCIYLYTNLLGNEAGRMIYDGDILIAQRGKLIGKNTRLSFKDVNLLAIEVDIYNTRESEVLVNERVYDPIKEFSIAAPLALFDYLRKSRSKGFVLSLSGGADSSSIAVLVAQMVKLGIDELGLNLFQEKLGFDLEIDRKLSKDEIRKNIVRKILTTAYQGTKNSSEDTLNSARELADSIGATFYNWLIDDQVSGYSKTIEKAIGRELNWETDDITLQNIQARARSPIIWMLANINNALLLTTSNRSEGDVGYATMDGDTSGSISPIAAVSKHFILQWLQYAEKELGYTGLSAVNQLQPTAELRPLEMHQTDEDDLMPYPIIVEIERLAIYHRKSPVEIFKTLKQKNLESDDLLKNHIAKFFRLWSRNQWKRERIAPSFHLDDFNVDPRTWCRFPILSSGFGKELQELERL
ncbi:MAG: NAD+ synthetase [bacterium]|nr:NAD+ synthetase [bacterium]